MLPNDPNLHHTLHQLNGADDECESQSETFTESETHGSPHAKRRRQNTNVYNPSQQARNFDPLDPNYNGIAYLLPSGDEVWVSSNKSRFHYVQSSRPTQHDCRDSVHWKRIETLKQLGIPQTKENVRVKWTKSTKCLTVDCSDVHDDSKLMDFTGFKVCHQFANYTRSIHTVAIDVSNPATSRKQNNAQPIDLHLNFAMIYEPQSFKLGTHTLLLSEQQLERQCNTFLREPEGTCYILLRHSQDDEETSVLLNELTHKTQPFANIDNKAAWQRNKSFLLSEKPTIGHGEKGDAAGLYHAVRVANTVFDLLCSRALHKQYIPTWVLIGTNQTIQLCYVFFQIWQRLVVVTQRPTDWHDYFQRRNTQRDFITLLAKCYFFGKLSRPNLLISPNGTHSNRPSPKFLTEDEVSMKAFISLFQRSFIPVRQSFTKSAWQKLLFDGTKFPDVSLKLSYNFDEWDKLTRDAFCSDLAHTIHARYPAPVLVQSTVGQQCLLFKLQLHYLAWNPKNPDPYGTWDVEAAAAMSRVMKLFPLLAWSEFQRFPRDRSDEADILLRQWFFSQLEPYNLIHRAAVGSTKPWPEYPTVPGIVSTSCGHDLFKWTADGLRRALSDNESLAIDFEQVLWDAEVVRYCCLASNQERQTVIGRLSRFMSNHITLSLRVESQRMAAPELPWNEWILRFDEAKNLPAIGFDLCPTITPLITDEPPATNPSQSLLSPMSGGSTLPTDGAPCLKSPVNNQTLTVTPHTPLQTSARGPEPTPSARELFPRIPFLTVPLYCSYKNENEEEYSGIVVSVVSYRVQWLRSDLSGQPVLDSSDSVTAVRFVDDIRWYDLKDVALMFGKLPDDALNRLKGSLFNWQGLFVNDGFTSNPFCPLPSRVKYRLSFDCPMFRPVLAGMQGDVIGPSGVLFSDVVISRVQAHNKISDWLELRHRNKQTKRILCKEVATFLIRGPRGHYTFRNPLFITGEMPDDALLTSSSMIFVYQSTDAVNRLQAGEPDQTFYSDYDFLFLRMQLKIHLTPALPDEDI